MKDKYSIISQTKRFYFSFTLFILFILILGFTYATFMIETIPEKALEIYVGKLNYNIDIKNMDDTKTGINGSVVSLNANESKFIKVTIGSLNEIITMYKLQYKSSASVTVKYRVNTPAFPSDTINEENVTGEVSVIYLYVKNNSATATTVSFDVKGGFTHNPVSEIELIPSYNEVTLVYSTYTNFVLGHEVTYILKPNKEVIGTGNNNYGQLGINSAPSTCLDRSNWPHNCATTFGSPIISGIDTISNKSNHALALKSNGDVWGWGSTQYGQLGTVAGNATCSVIGTNYSCQKTPTGPIITGVKKAVAGDIFSAVIKTNGEVWTTGLNMYGSLGKASSDSCYFISGYYSCSKKFIGPIISDIKDISLSFSTAYALKTNGDLWTWGDSSSGQIGDNTTTQKNTPVGPIMSDVKQVSAGGYFVAVLKNNGEVWTWGSNVTGQLGNGTRTGSNKPIGPILTGVSKIAAGTSHVLALKTNGEVWVWGGNTGGQLGSSAITEKCGINSCSTVPFGPILRDIEDIVSGGYHSFALSKSKETYLWGENNMGQIGNGTIEKLFDPVKVELEN